jgi:hypothetical protein
VTDVTGEKAFDSREEGGCDPEAEEHQARRRGQEGRSHEEAQDRDGEEVDTQEEHQARRRGQEGRSDQEAQDGGAEVDRPQVDSAQDDSQKEVDRVETDLRPQARGEEEDDASQDDEKEGRVAGSFDWSGRGAIAPLPRSRGISGRIRSVAC